MCKADGKDSADHRGGDEFDLPCSQVRQNVLTVSQARMIFSFLVLAFRFRGAYEYCRELRWIKELSALLLFLDAKSHKEPRAHAHAASLRIYSAIAGPLCWLLS